MTAFMKEAEKDFLKSKMVNGCKNHAFPKHTQWGFPIFIKEKKVVHYEGDAHFGVVIMEPMKIIGWLGENGQTHNWMNAKDHISFALLDVKSIQESSFEGTMSTLCYNPFLTRFVEYTSLRMKEPDVWL